MPNKYINIILNKDGIILEFDSTIEDLGYHENEVLGNNWFDIFIEPIEKDTLSNLHRSYFSNYDFDDISSWQHTNDIRTKDGHHRLIDFENTILIYPDGTKAIYSMGLEHYIKHLSVYYY